MHWVISPPVSDSCCTVAWWLEVGSSWGLTRFPDKKKRAYKWISNIPKLSYQSTCDTQSTFLSSNIMSMSPRHDTSIPRQWYPQQWSEICASALSGQRKMNSSFAVAERLSTINVERKKLLGHIGPLPKVQYEVLQYVHRIRCLQNQSVKSIIKSICKDRQNTKYKITKAIWHHYCSCFRKPEHFADSNFASKNISISHHAMHVIAHAWGPEMEGPQDVHGSSRYVFVYLYMHTAYIFIYLTSMLLVPICIHVICIYTGLYGHLPARTYL